MKRLATLVYLKKAHTLCLGLKKRGFGEGNWNGYGGKIEENESIEEAAIRELQEESTVHANATDLAKIAVIDFLFEDGTKIETHAFFLEVWNGEPIETEEMTPEWFSYDAIPYDRMWEDDRHWLPRALSGERLRGVVYFDESAAHIKKMEWQSVAAIKNTIA